MFPMRPLARLISTAVSLFTFLFIGGVLLDANANSVSTSDHVRSTVPQHPPFAVQIALPNLESKPVNSLLTDLWFRWSRLMHDARPYGPKIRLTADARTYRPEYTGTSARTPYEDLVANPPKDIESLRRHHDDFMQELRLPLDTSNLFSGHGIVMVAGGEFFGPAITSILMLRRTGSTLPVEIFVANEAEYEEYVCEHYLPMFNAKCLVLTKYLSEGSHVFKAKRFQLKALAILFSSFQHVLFLDSDSMPLVDPYVEMMMVEPYISTGMIIWPDFWRATESPSFWKIAGLGHFPKGLPMTASETGQILINKGTHLKALILATYYNIYGPEYYFPLLSQGAMGQGDKETFMAAAVVMGSRYYRVNEPVAAVMDDDGEKDRGVAMVQYHPGDDYNVTMEEGKNSSLIRPAFLHANAPKMNAGRIMDEKNGFSRADITKRWRLLGSKEHQISRFGYDLEVTLWDLMVQIGCDLEQILRDWRRRENLCARLHEHVDTLFGDERRMGRLRSMIMTRHPHSNMDVTR